jgi:hypothetical protein
MLADSKNSKLYTEFLSFIKSEETKDAFRYLVGCAATLKTYFCHPHQSDKRNKRELQFWNAKHDEQPFAFITNQKWLLFYFRQPAVLSHQYKKELVQAAFKSFKENNLGEWTVKLRSVTDVQRLWSLLAIK